jgi:serine/threonine protein kinase
MALVNIAELLYRAGSKVLMVDWDLEAPGLERFYPSKVKQVLSSPGIIEMLLTYKEKASRFEPGSGESFFPVYDIQRDYLVDISREGVSSGKLWLLPAGYRADDQFFEYADRVKTFDWQDLYQNWEGEIFFEWLRQQLNSLADTVLIDSRTGVTEMGGVCTYQMADVVVMFCAANEQNIDGTLQMVRSFSDPRLPELRHDRKLTTLVVPARIERVAETVTLNRFRQEFVRRFAPYMPTELQSDPDFLVQLEIPYVPLYAFEEIIAVNQTKSLERAVDMERAYSGLARVLTSLAESDLAPKIEEQFRSRFSVGDILERKYEILEYLGRGSRGDVYLAEDRLLARKVAVKHLRPGSTHEQADVEHFLAEARTIARIRDENVVAIYDAIEEEQERNYYLIMEYADEGTVADRLEGEKKLPVLETLEIGLAATRALEVVHAQGILHGDIKPSNILFFSGPDRVWAKLADFGLSQVITGAQDEPDAYPGSILYSSPEQLTGEEVDQRADLYALGAVLYEMLTGQPPFLYTGKSENLAQVIQGRLEETPAPPSQLNPDVSPAVDEVILKALRKAPDERYPDAQGMGQALRQAMDAQRDWQERIETAYKQGLEHEQRKEWHEAIACYEAVLAEQPSGPLEVQRRLRQARKNLDWDRLFRQGLEAYEQGEWTEAEKILSQVVAADESYAQGEAATKLAEARRQKELDKLYNAASEQEASEKWSESVYSYIKILSLESDYKDVAARLAYVTLQQKQQTLYDQAQDYLVAEDWVEAIGKLQELENLGPSYKDSAALLDKARRHTHLQELYIRATEALDKSDWALAVEVFTEILQIDSEYKDAAVKRVMAERQARPTDLYRRAQAQLASEEWENAITTLQQIQEISPSYQDVGHLLEEAKLRRESWERREKGLLERFLAAIKRVFGRTP